MMKHSDIKMKCAIDCCDIGTSQNQGLPIFCAFSLKHFEPPVKSLRFTVGQIHRFSIYKITDNFN